SPGRAAGGELLDALAVIGQSRNSALLAGLAAVRGSGGRDGEGLVVAIFGALSAAEARAVASARRGTATGVAILMNPAEAGATAATGPAAAFLRASGWRVLVLSSATELAAAWTGVEQGVSS
ncbi:MAG: hypothetical protein ABIS86_16705, partial [Streptosporangiaceae bacterium]